MGVLLLLGVDVVAEILVWLGRTKILLLLVKVNFNGKGRLGEMFGDEACGQVRPWREVAVIDGGNEGSLGRAEGCSVKVLGKFALGDIMEENAV